MKKSGILLILLFVCSCASEPRLASSEKFERVKIGQDSYKRPAFFFHPHARPATPLRAPSSVDDSSVNVKNAYFLGLWQQKLKMEKLLGVTSKNHCPAFHNELLKHESFFKAADMSHALNQDWEKIVHQENLVSQPVLALPYDGTKDLYTFYQEEKSLDQDQVMTAFENFYKETEKEARQLCQTGSSDGYFIYANLVEYYSNNESFMDSEAALQALLKVPSVANFYVLHSLKQSGVAMADPIEMLMLKKLNASWFQSYLYNVKKLGDDKLSSNKIGSSR